MQDNEFVLQKDDEIDILGADSPGMPGHRKKEREMEEIIRDAHVDKLFSVKDKVVLIVGAGGLGEYIGHGMAENGAKIVFTNTTLKKAEGVQARFRGDGLDCDIFQLNVTDNDQIRQVVDAIVEKHGRIDVLINTAAICAHSEPENYDPDVVRRVLDVNTNGTIFVAREVGKVMIRQHYGKIINFGSIAGGYCHTYLSMPYEASKAAVHQFTRSLAVTWAKHNINVNCISPTWVYTPMLDGLQEDVYDDLKKQHPGGRLAEVNDFMGIAMFLASDASSYVTGQVIYVDGGWTSGKPVIIPDEERCVTHK